MKVNKSGDDSGLVVELVQFLQNFSKDLLHLDNAVLNTCKQLSMHLEQNDVHHAHKNQTCKVAGRITSVRIL